MTGSLSDYAESHLQMALKAFFNEGTDQLIMYELGYRHGHHVGREESQHQKKKVKKHV